MFILLANYFNNNFGNFSAANYSIRGWSFLPKLIHETITGTIVGNRFYYANSGIDAYRNDGSLATDKLEAPVIMKCIFKIVAT